MEKYTADRPSNDQLYDRWMKCTYEECHAAIAAAVPLRQTEIKEDTDKGNLAEILATSRVKVPAANVLTSITNAYLNGRTLRPRKSRSRSKTPRAPPPPPKKPKQRSTSNSRDKHRSNSRQRRDRANRQGQEHKRDGNRKKSRSRQPSRQRQGRQRSRQRGNRQQSPPRDPPSNPNRNHQLQNQHWDPRDQPHSPNRFAGQNPSFFPNRFQRGHNLSQAARQRAVSFAQNFALKENVGYLVAEGQFTEVYQTTPGQLTIGSSSSHREHSHFVLASTHAERRAICQTPRAYSTGLEPLLQGRELFSDILPKWRPVGFAVLSRDRTYYNWVMCVLWMGITALGVHLIDSLIRQFCARHRQPWWPLPQELNGTIAVLTAVHVRKNAITCLICGHLDHTTLECARRDIYTESAPRITTTQPHKPNGGATKRKDGVCHYFMRSKQKGSCKQTTCNLSHTCPKCGGTSTHNKNCKR
jgi:hypothetical protein